MIAEVTRKDVQDARRALAKCQEYRQRAEVAKALKLDCTETDEVCDAVEQFLKDWLEVHGGQFPERK